jgi:hypothetical protein
MSHEVVRYSSSIIVISISMWCRQRGAVVVVVVVIVYNEAKSQKRNKRAKNNSPHCHQFVVGEQEDFIGIVRERRQE